MKSITFINLSNCKFISLLNFITSASCILKLLLYAYSYRIVTSWLQQFNFYVPLCDYLHVSSWVLLSSLNLSRVFIKLRNFITIISSNIVFCHLLCWHYKYTYVRLTNIALQITDALFIHFSVFYFTLGSFYHYVLKITDYFFSCTAKPTVNLT